MLESKKNEVLLKQKLEQAHEKYKEDLNQSHKDYLQKEKDMEEKLKFSETVKKPESDKVEKELTEIKYRIDQLTNSVCLVKSS